MQATVTVSYYYAHVICFGSLTGPPSYLTARQQPIFIHVCVCQKENRSDVGDSNVPCPHTWPYLPF